MKSYYVVNGDGTVLHNLELLAVKNRWRQTCKTGGTDRWKRQVDRTGETSCSW